MDDHAVAETDFCLLRNALCARQVEAFARPGAASATPDAVLAGCDTEEAPHLFHLVD